MIMAFNNRKLTIAFGVVALFFIEVATIFNLTNNKLKINCESVFSFNNTTSDVKTIGSIIFRLNDDSTGVTEISGNLIEKSSISHIHRRITYNYKKINEDEYIIYNLKIEKFTKDIAKENVLSELFLSATHSNEFYLTINKQKNAWLFGNSNSPMFMCVNKL